MDTIQHMAWSVPISFGAQEVFKIGTTETIILGGALAIFGGLPDFIGFFEKVYRKFKKDPNYKNAWNWYLWAHNYPWMLAWVPTYALHIWLDSFVHDDTNRWWVPGEGLKYEIISWVVLLFITASFVIF